MTPPPYVPFQQQGSSLWFYADHKGKKSPGYHSHSKCQTDADTAQTASLKTAEGITSAIMAKADAAFSAKGWPENHREGYMVGWLSGELREALAAAPKAYREATVRRLQAKAADPATATST